MLAHPPQVVSLLPSTPGLWWMTEDFMDKRSTGREGVLNLCPRYLCCLSSMVAGQRIGQRAEPDGLVQGSSHPLPILQVWQYALSRLSVHERAAEMGQNRRRVMRKK